MKTRSSSLNYERDRWIAATARSPRWPARSTARRWRRPAPAASISEGCSPRPRGRRAGAAQAHVPRARADDQGARPRDHGAQGGAVRAQLLDRRDPQGRLDRYRGRRRHAVLLLVQGPARAARRACPARWPARGAVQDRAPSSASTSIRRCRARRCTSTPSTSRCGACSRSSRRPCSRAFRRS